MNKTKILVLLILTTLLLISCGNSDEKTSQENSDTRNQDITKTETIEESNKTNTLFELEKDLIVTNSTLGLEEVFMYEGTRIELSHINKEQTMILELEVENPNNHPYEITPKISVSFDSKDNYGDIIKNSNILSQKSIYSPYQLKNNKVIIQGKEKKKIYYYIPLKRINNLDGKVELYFQADENGCSLGRTDFLTKFYDWKFEGLTAKKVENTEPKVFINPEESLELSNIVYQSGKAFLGGTLTNHTDMKWRKAEFVVNAELVYTDGHKEKLIPYQNFYEVPPNTHVAEYIKNGQRVNLLDKEYSFCPKKMENAEIHVFPTVMYYIPDSNN